MKKILSIFSICALMLGGLTGCYKENEIVPDLLTSLGNVPYISVFWAGTTRLTTTVTVDSGTDVVLTAEYLSEVPVKEFRLLTRVGTTGTYTLVSTTPLASAGVVYDAKLRNNVVKFTIKAPAAKNATQQYAAEITGTNELIGVQRSVTIRTRP